MASINIVHGANGTRGETVERVIRDLSRTFARQALVTAAVAALTDNSTGAVTAFTIPASTPKATAGATNNLADVATTNTAIGTVTAAIATLYAKVNAISTALGVPTTVYNGGGASGGNTIAAVTKSVTGAATGAPLASYEAARLAVNGQLTRLHALINRVAQGVGVPRLTSVSGETGASVAVPTVAAATAAGVTKAKVDADLTAWANDIAILAAKLNAVLGVDAKPLVIVVD